MNNNYTENIIINRMYAGAYLNNNIGHEIINTYKTDNNENYIYINPWGTINSDKQNVSHVVLVRAISAHCYEVMSYATELELLLSDKAMKKQRQAGNIDNEKQNEIIENNKITYGNMPINKIFSEQNNTVFVTFKANKYRNVCSNQKLYIVDKIEEVKSENYIYIPNLKFSSESLKRYVDKEQDAAAYETLLRLISDNSRWETYDSSTSVKLDKERNNMFNILDVIGKQDDELAYSNWLAYYLNDISIIKDFANEVLNISLDTSDISLIREYKNIDIWLSSKSHVVVLENKIKSGINGVNNERHDIKSELVKSQLSKYVEIAEKEANNRTAAFYILLPDYSYNDEDLSIYLQGDRYTIIRYSQLLNFFEKHNYKVPYMDEFIISLRKHSSVYRKDLYETMDEKFINMINSKANM